MKNINILAAVLASFGGNPVALAEEPYSIEWARQFGTNAYEAGNAVATDPWGNIFVTGNTNGNLNGQPSAGGTDAFLAKFNAAGSVLWTRLIGTSNGESGLDVAIDQAGNAIVAGRTRLPGGNGDFGAFVTKFDTTGSTIWINQFGTSAHDQALSLSVDPGGSLYLAGYTSGDLDGQTNSGEKDAFVRKLDSDGVFQWGRLLGTASDEEAQSIAVDAFGNAYVAGFTDGSLGGTQNNGGRDAFLAKYDNSGTRQWVTLLGSPATEGATAVSVNNSGNVYLTGHADGDLDGQTGSGFADTFLAKYDANGSGLWTRLFGSTLSDDAYDLAVDNTTGSVFVTGWTYGDLSSVNQGTLDMFMTKWNSEGSPSWTIQLGTDGWDEGKGIAVDGSGSVYLTGSTSKSLFGPDAGNNLDDDVFLVKFTPEPFGAVLLLLGWLTVPKQRYVR